MNIEAIEISTERLATVEARLRGLGALAMLTEQQAQYRDGLMLEQLVISNAIQSQEPHYHYSRKFAA